MKNKLNKKVLKEDEGLSTPKPINRYEPSDVEKTIRGVLEKDFKDFTLKTYQHQGETQYINLVIISEVPEEEGLRNDLELKRYVISRMLSEFRKEFLTELSKNLNVVNVNCGSYSFVKNTDNKIVFTVTILLSDNNISDWVSGNRKKIEQNKELVKESKIMNKNNNALNEMKEVRNVLLKLHEAVINEGKVVKSFETKRDEFEVKESLSKKGFKSSVEKAGVVRVTYNDKKNSESDIKKLVESKELKNVRIILESIYKEVLKEARPKKKITDEEEIEDEPIIQNIDTKSERKLQKAIKEYSSLTQEIEEQQRKFLEKRVNKQMKLEETIFSTMKSVNLNLYIVDEIVAKLSAEFERENTKYAAMFEELLTKVNDDTKKVITKLKKKYTSKITIQSRLSVEPPTFPKGKGRRNESIIKEGIINWIKGLYSTLKNYLSELTDSRKKLQKLAHDANLM